MTEDYFVESPSDPASLSYRCAYSLDNKLIYVGSAKAGSLQSDPVWRIKKRVFSGQNLTEVLYAGGNGQFINVWDNRELYSYS